MSNELGTQVLIRLPDELVEWIDAERDASGRSRAWLIGHAVEIWRNRLQRDRERRAAKLLDRKPAAGARKR